MKGSRQKWLITILTVLTAIALVWGCAEPSNPTESENPSVTDAGVDTDPEPDAETSYRGSYGGRPFKAQANSRDGYLHPGLRGSTFKVPG